MVNQIIRFAFWVISFTTISLLLTGCSSEKTIVNALDERQANEIIVFLNSKGIESSKTVNTSSGGGGGGSKIVYWDINVSADKAQEAMALLSANGLPRHPQQNLLNIFSGQGLVPSEMEQKIRYQAGLAEQIASVIRKIDGVLEADVQLSFPEEDPLNPNIKKGKTTASVYIKHSGVLDDPNSHLVTKIKRLVASSVPGLSYDDVTIIPDRARLSETYPETQSSITEEPHEYVSIWSIIIAKASVSRFRLIFFSLCLLVLLLLLLQIWIVWKVYPLLHKRGGFKQLFNIHPLSLEEHPEGSQETKTEEAKKEETDKIVKGEDTNDSDQAT